MKNQGKHRYSLWAFVAAFSMALGLALLAAQQPPERIVAGPSGLLAVAMLAFAGFQIAMFPVVGALSAPRWARAAGYVWLSLGLVMVAMRWNGVSVATLDPMRWGQHLVAAIWILAAAATNRSIVRWLGALTGVWFGGYSFFAPWLSEMAFAPSMILLVVWVVFVGVHLNKEGAAADDALAGATEGMGQKAKTP